MPGERNSRRWLVPYFAMFCVGLGCAYAPATRDVPGAGDDGGTLPDSGTIANGDESGTAVGSSSGSGSSGSTSSSSGSAGNGSSASSGGSSSSGSSGSSSSGAAVPTILFVQIAAASPVLMAKSGSVTFTQAQTAGNLIVLAVGWHDTTSKFSSVSDLAGDTFQLAVKSVGNGLSQSIYYASKVAAWPSNKITATLTGTAQKVELGAIEYSGVSAFDTASGLNQAGAAANSGTATPSGSPPELLVAAGITAQKYSGAVPPGFMLRTPTNSAAIVEDRLTSRTGGYSASAPVMPPGDWLMQLAAFR